MSSSRHLTGSPLRLLRVAGPALGAAMITIALAADLVGFGGHVSLGRSQQALILCGMLLLVTNLFLAGPGHRLIGSALAAAGAALAVAAGMTQSADFVVAAGLGILGGASLADLAGQRRYYAEVVSSAGLRAGNIGHFILFAAQAALLGLIVRQYHIENQAFSEIILLIVLAGFAINFFLPRSVRLQFFLLLSMAAFAVVLGIANFLALLAAAGLLITIIHMPVPFRWRVAMLVITGTAMAFFRAGQHPRLLPAAVWPILGSIFMFRLIIYAYDLYHSREKLPYVSRLSYFFMLPNVVFPFYPIVDFSTFRRSYYETDQREITQRGLIFLFWGVTHLILYRVVNYYFLISPDKIQTLADLGRYIVSNFMLYLRVSGQFHLIIGVLHLFGFNLPSANNRYFLSSSFTDLWRRMNIYWKDFMLKIFYYPIYFRLKNLGETRSMILATIAVFVITWLLHGYQWFWLRGSFLFSATDMLFWTILGLLVVINSLWEARRKRRRRISRGKMAAAGWRLPALRTAGTFAAMAIIWSLWSSRSVAEWLTLWSSAAQGVRLNAGLLLTLFSVVMLGTGAARSVDGSRKGTATKGTGKTTGVFRSAALTAAGFVILLLMGNPMVARQMGRSFENIMRDLRWNRLGERDQTEMERGYYENLNAVNSFNSQLWEIYMRRPIYKGIWETDAVRKTGDYLANELNPNVNIIFRGEPYRTNQWGMRDRDYEKVPPPGTLRIALLGASHTEGWGVGNEENFDHLLETRLNQDKPFAGYPRYEVLNFAVGGYLPVQVMMSLERKALDFQPDAVLLEAHPGDAERTVWHLAQGVLSRVPNPYPDLEAITTEAGIVPEMELRQAVRKLLPFGDRALAFVYMRMGELCRERGIPAIMFYTPAVPGQEGFKELAVVSEMARQGGFEVIDMSNVYDGYDLDQVRIAEWDQHPSRQGHRILADRLYGELTQRPRILEAARATRPGAE